MKIAIPIWNSRVSPVFDVARKVLIIDVENGVEKGRYEHHLESTDLVARAAEIANLRIDVLICGAISRPLETMIMANGVKVIAQTCGEVEEVLEAYISGKLFTLEQFFMPGCWRQGKRWRHGRRFGNFSRM